MKKKYLFKLTIVRLNWVLKLAKWPVYLTASSRAPIFSWHRKALWALQLKNCHKRTDTQVAKKAPIVRFPYNLTKSLFSIMFFPRPWYIWKCLLCIFSNLNFSDFNIAKYNIGEVDVDIGFGNGRRNNKIAF